MGFTYYYFFNSNGIHFIIIPKNELKKAWFLEWAPLQGRFLDVGQELYGISLARLWEKTVLCCFKAAVVFMYPLGKCFPACSMFGFLWLKTATKHNSRFVFTRSKFSLIVNTVKSPFIRNIGNFCKSQPLYNVS